MTEEEYRSKWKETGPIEIKMIEKHGKCKHQLGDTFHYQTPMKDQMKYALLCFTFLIFIHGELHKGSLRGKRTTEMCTKFIVPQSLEQCGK